MREENAIERSAERLAALSSRTGLAERINWLRQHGPRETGNIEHVRFVNHIAEQVASLGFRVHKDTHRFDRWSVHDTSSRCALTVHGPGVESPIVLVASAYPYSGNTGPNGVTGPLQLFNCSRWWKDGIGKIAVVEVPNPSVPIKLLFDEIGHLPAGAAGFPDTYRHPVLSSTVFGPDLAAAKAAGAIGLVAVWRGLTAAQAADQYVPFTFPYRDIPAVWVAGDEGEQLLESARHGFRATLTLDATLSPNAMTDTVWTVVEGEISNESILVVTHSDGVNPIEENGAIGVLELARMFASGARPKRTLVFVFVTGHLRLPAVTGHGQAATAWLTAHPEWWSGKNGAPRAVAGLVIEHLGALARARGSSHDQVEPAVELTYATNSAMLEILKTSWAGRQRGKVLIAQPGCLIHFGEGEPLYKQGIPAIALASVPEYLLVTTKADIVDIELMHEQVDAFARALLLLESSPAQLLGKAKPVELTKKISTYVKLFFSLPAVQLFFSICPRL